MTVEEKPPAPALDLAGLRAVSVLGRGAKGVAFLIRLDGELLALKAISRASVERKQSDDCYRRIRFERDVLRSLDHPLLPSLRGVVETERVIGFAITYCPGGDLTSLRRRQTEKMFSDDVIRFYAAELVLVLDYLHKQGIVYRDLKPENILIQESGHLMLIDFDLSAKLAVKSSDFSSSPATVKRTISGRKKSLLPALFRCVAARDHAGSTEESLAAVGASPDFSGKSNSFVGTEDYVAPEIVSGDGHDFGVDLWSVGVVLYEMLYGKTPFRGANRKETFYRILAKAPDLAGEPSHLRDLIRRLLEKEPARRISVGEVKKHEFFEGVDWENVVRISRPPHIPPAAEEEAPPAEWIDVEDVMEKVFRCEKTNLTSEDKKGVWVEGLNKQKDDFLVF